VERGGDGSAITNVAPGKGGVERDPQTIHAHTFPGAANNELLQNSLTMKTSALREGSCILVTVSLTNDKTGHHIPTDSPLRYMILLVEAKDTLGNSLDLVEGEIVPQWGGVGDWRQEAASKGYYAGLPGKAFAKILVEMWTEITPTGAYWNPTRLVSDNRLAAFATDVSQYTFSAQPQGEVLVKVRLIYRRAYRALADPKGWQIATGGRLDILMEEEELQVN